MNEPANVTVGGKPANVSADNRFEGQAVVPSGTGQVQVTATDPSGNVRTNTYEVSQAGAGKSFTYDGNGNMTSDGTRTYEWDAENRLVAVRQGGSTVASYAYNSSGIRTSKTVGGVTTSYMLEGDNVVEERAGGVTTKDLQGPGIDNVLATQDSAGTLTYLTRDHLGSIRELASPTGDVTLRRDHDPWGNLTAGADANGWAFTGREWEANVGLAYHRARWYEPRIGRFVSEDPIASDQSVYSYAANQPMSFVDPSGLIIDMTLHERAARYNVTRTCSGRTAPGGASCYRRMVTTVGDCRGSGGCYGFDVVFTVDLWEEFTVSQQDANQPNSSGNSPGLTLKQHEDLHIRDYRRGMTARAINRAIPTEGFTSFSACTAARDTVVGRIDAFLHGVAAASGRRRD